MRYILTATRWLIAVVTNMHLFSLKTAVKQSATSVVKAGIRTDAARLARDVATADHIATRSLEAVVKKGHAALVAAAQAEANTLRRDYAVA